MILHNDVDMPFPKPGQEPYQVVQLRDLFKRHPKTTSSGRTAASAASSTPSRTRSGSSSARSRTPSSTHLYIDISWDEVAKYLVATPETIAGDGDLINRHPDRFLFGTDEVAPTEQAKYLKVYDMYAPLFAKLTPEASEKVRKGNYERLFDEARREGPGVGEGEPEMKKEAIVRRTIVASLLLAAAPRRAGRAGGRRGGPRARRRRPRPPRPRPGPRPRPRPKPRMDIYGFAMLDMGYQTEAERPELVRRAAADQAAVLRRTSSARTATTSPASARAASA